MVAAVVTFSFEYEEKAGDSIPSVADPVDRKRTFVADLQYRLVQNDPPVQVTYRNDRAEVQAALNSMVIFAREPLNSCAA
jgi:hypothetical protein